MRDMIDIGMREMIDRGKPTCETWFMIHIIRQHPRHPTRKLGMSIQQARLVTIYGSFAEGLRLRCRMYKALLRVNRNVPLCVYSARETLWLNLQRDVACTSHVLRILQGSLMECMSIFCSMYKAYLRNIYGSFAECTRLCCVFTVMYLGACMHARKTVWLNRLGSFA